MDNKIEDRIKCVMSAVLEISADEINDESSPNSIESWDSLKYINLIVALEEEFEIEFTDNEISEMINFSLIKEIIKSY
jgi:acyl carrier protein